MKRNCAWCNTEIGADVALHPGLRIAHTLCSACSEHFVFQMGVPLQVFLDGLPAPIFVVDDNVVVQAANRMGYAMLKKGSERVLKKLGGEVFECAYSRLPEGCGRTIHCSGCAIRRSVYHTAETGESLLDVPATLKCGDLDAPQEISMRISTERLGDLILLRIDNVADRAAA